MSPPFWALPLSNLEMPAISRLLHGFCHLSYVSAITSLWIKYIIALFITDPTKYQHAGQTYRPGIQKLLLNSI